MRDGGMWAGGTALISPGRRVAYLVQYLLVIVAAELLLVFGELFANSFLVILGVLLYIMLVLILLVQASLLAREAPFAKFLVAMTLAPLVRIVGLTATRTPFTTVQWLAIASLPLLVAAIAVMRSQGLRSTDVFLTPGSRRSLPINAALAVSGIGIGFLEYQVLPPQPSLGVPNFETLVFAVIVVFFATGFVEEFIFRGILLGTGSRALGPRVAIVYLTGVFTALHIGFTPALYLPLNFVIGFVFSLAVVSTRSLWGAICARGLANVTLYLLIPLVF